MKEKILIITLFGLLAGMVLVQSGTLSAQTQPAAGCQEAMTIFQDVSVFGRKSGAAKNMSKKHREYAKDGWRFEDMEVYVENGDLEGFFLTYSRDTTCG